MPQLHDRAQNLRKRLKILGVTHGITNKGVAESIGYTPVYLSAVLRGVYESQVVLDLVESHLDSIESGELDTDEEPQLAQAA